MPGQPRGAHLRVRSVTPLLAFVAAMVAVVALGPATDDTGRDAPGSNGASAPPRRVVSLLPSATELLGAMGAGAWIVGRSRFDSAPAASGARVVGDVVHPSVETVISLEPDLVVTWRGVTDPAAVRGLEESGLPVYEAWMESVDDVLRTARELGDRLAIPARGDSLAREIAAGLDAVAAAAPTTGLGVLVVLHPEPLLTAGPGSYLDRLIGVAGARNIFADAGSPWPRVSLEAVIRRDPDAVVVSGRGGGPPGWMRRDDRWAGMAAVRSGRVLVLPPELLSRPGSRIVETARRLSAFLERAAATDAVGEGR